MRGEVWLVRLDPTVGSEIRKTRPCVVVSPDRLSHQPTCILAPMTTGGRPARFRVPVTFQGKDGLILPDQVRTVARARLLRRVGSIDQEALAQALAILRLMFED